MAARFHDPKPIFWDDDGLACAGGYLTFAEDDTTTPKTVWAERALSTSLGSSVDLDASGRAESDIWFEGSCYVRLFNAADVQIWARANVEDGAFAGNAPLSPEDGDDNDVYRTDGTPGGAYWGPVEEVAAVSGQPGKYYGNDGETHGWYAFPVAEEYTSANLPGGITSSVTRVVVGVVAFVWGNDTAPSTGTLKTTKAVTFGTAFSGTPYHVSVIPTSATSTGESGACSSQALSASASGFTASFFAGAEDNGGVAEINTTVPFTYFAVGPA